MKNILLLPLTMLLSFITIFCQAQQTTLPIQKIEQSKKHSSNKILKRAINKPQGDDRISMSPSQMQRSYPKTSSFHWNAWWMNIIYGMISSCLCMLFVYRRMNHAPLRKGVRGKNNTRSQNHAPTNIQSSKQEYNPEANAILSTQNSFLRELYAHIEEEIDNAALSTEDLAKKMMMSRRHLNRKLNQQIGISTCQLIKQCRLKKACSLLKNKTPIAETAYSTGFTTPSYFSTSFKAFYGLSPSEYAKTSFS